MSFGAVLSSEPQIVNSPNEYRLNNPPTDGVSSLKFSPDPNSRLLLASSWDGSVRLYDVGTSSQNFQRMSYMHNAPVLACTFLDAVRCASGGLDNSVKLYDFNTNSGRVAVEFIEPDPETQKKKYAFKCHRIKEEGQEFIYPVNAIAFHPIHNTFATGGSDSLVNIWDPFNKKRLCQFHKYPTSISALAFNGDGSLLAIGSSYQYEYPQDPSPLPEDQIFIRKVTDQETKPKS